MIKQIAKSICIAFITAIFFTSAPSAHAQPNNATPKINRYPNELRGYEFYQNEKVKQLIPAVSTSEDIRRIFGETCCGLYDYDENWKIAFSYFGSDWEEINNFKGYASTWIKYEYPSEIVGRLSTITFIPKKNFDFNRISEKCSFIDIEDKLAANLSKFQKEFRCALGLQSHPNVSLINFSDKYGLTYRICDSDKKPEANCRKGDLWNIEYSISNEENERIKKQSTVKK